MKIIIASLLVIFSSLQGIAQITITDTDMPSVNDTFRVSNGLITPAIDPVPTGIAFTWDFSSLQWIWQEVDSFISVSSTGPVYSIVFVNIPFNPYRANLAARGPDLPTVPFFSLTDVNYFYYNSSGSYELSGYGAFINGLPVPVPFNNKDRIFDFPLNFGNTDSSDSDFQVSLPGVGFYGHNQHRVNEVDGWGTLITPYGTFPTLRVKSTVTSNDSLYLDTLGTGFGFSVPQTIEYKWLGNNQGIPLLQINTTVTTPGTEIVTSIRYRDSLRVLTGTSEYQVLDAGFSVYPNPAVSEIFVDIDSPLSESVTLVLYNAMGQKVSELFTGNKIPGHQKFRFDAGVLPDTDGIYFIRATIGNSTQTRSFLFSNQ